jgi:preprotein translocase subunit SecG
MRQEFTMLKWYDIIFIIVSLIVIVLSLLQGGKSEGASGAITGGGLNVFAKTKERGSEKVVSWLTFGFAVLFLFLALLIMILGNKAAAEASSSSAASSAAALALPLFF